MKCPIPRPASRILTAAGPVSVPCDGEATVLSLAPYKAPNGDTEFQYVRTCLDHAIRIACWKLIIAVDEQQRLAEQNRRIHTI